MNSMNKKRLNLLALPSETNIRFVILIVAAIVIAFQSAILITHLSGGFASALQWALFSFYLRSDILAGTDFLLDLSDAELALLAGQTLPLQWNAFISIVPGLAMVLLFVLIFLAGAYIIYRTHPERILAASRTQPVAVDLAAVPEIQQTVQALGITSLTGFAIVPRKKSFALNAQAFGVGNRHRVLLHGDPRWLKRVWLSNPQFQAVLLHEIGHIATGDVWRTYASAALWRAFLILVALPILLFVLLFPFFLDVTPNVWQIFAFILRLVGLFGFIWAVWASLIRTRELYADWWAATRPVESGVSLHAHLIAAGQAQQRDEQQASVQMKEQPPDEQAGLIDMLRISLKQFMSTHDLHRLMLLVLAIVLVTVFLFGLLPGLETVPQPVTPGLSPALVAPWAGFILLVLGPTLLFLFIVPLQVIYDATIRWSQETLRKGFKPGKASPGETQAVTEQPESNSGQYAPTGEASQIIKEHGLRNWRLWLKSWLSFHPSAEKRKATLSDATWLFHISTQLPLLTGLLLSLVLGALIFFALTFGLFITQLTEMIIWTVAPALLNLPNDIDRPLLAGLILTVGVGLPVIFFFSLLFGVAYLAAETIGRQVQRMAVANLATHTSTWKEYLQLVKPALLLTLGLEAGFLVSGIFVSQTAMIWAMTLVWLILFSGFVWVWLVSTHFIAHMLLGSRTTQPRRSLRLTSIISAVTLCFIFCGLLPSRAVLVIIGAVPLLQPLLPASVNFYDFFVVYIGGLGLFALPIALLSVIMAFVLTPIITLLLVTIRKSRCVCGVEHEEIIVVGKQCRNEECRVDLAPWVFVTDTPQTSSDALPLPASATAMRSMQTGAVSPQTMPIAVQPTDDTILSPPPDVLPEAAIALPGANVPETPVARSRPGNGARLALLFLVMASTGAGLFGALLAVSPLLVDLPMPDGSIASPGIGLLSGLFCLIIGGIFGVAAILVWTFFVRPSLLQQTRSTGVTQHASEQ